MAGSHQRNVGPMQSAPRCGARTRSGATCKSPRVSRAARCRMHGGRGSGAPLGNSNAVKHGAYDRQMKEYAQIVRELLAQIIEVIRS